jgi:hypothetical protein
MQNDLKWEDQEWTELGRHWTEGTFLATKP